jgi:hypothetical protein
MQTAQRLYRQAIADGIIVPVAAAAIVGVAIAIGGDARRAINGIGGMLWLIGTVIVVTRAVAAGINRNQVILIGIVIALLTWLVRPVDPAWAAIGFGWGGVVVGYFGGRIGSKAGAMLAALWLPTHLLMAVGRAAFEALRDESTVVRTDPPPTAALVPLIMVGAAWLFATLTAEWRLNRSEPKNILRARSPRVRRSYD